MSCSTLYFIFGRDTRPVQIINVVVSGVWATAFLLRLMDVITIAMSPTLASHSVALLSVSIVTVVFGVAGLVTRGRPHQIFKAFGLTLGALTQAIAANSFASKYPPLDMQTVECAGLSIWYLLAVFYIFKCEGVNE